MTIDKKAGPYKVWEDVPQQQYVNDGVQVLTVAPRQFKKKGLRSLYPIRCLFPTLTRQLLALFAIGALYRLLGLVSLVLWNREKKI